MRLYVRTLKLTDFRNYARAELKLDARPVVLIGDNGSGKTNLLEAVSLLGAGTGLRSRPYAELCRKDGAGGFAVAAKVVSREDEVEIGTGVPAGSIEESKGRTVRIAGKDASAGALSEHVKLVWLIPAMDGLFTGSASERRRFLDRLVLAVDAKMRSPQGRYDRAMRQRNRLFQMREGSRALFEGLEEQMAEAGTAIAAARLDAVARRGLIERMREARARPFRGRRSLEGGWKRFVAAAGGEVEDEFRALLARRERTARSRRRSRPHLSVSS
jgi:DNA replication and repair protein RecF